MKILALLSISMIALVACARNQGQSDQTPVVRPAVIWNDEAQVRLAIYAHYATSESQLYIVDESEVFIRALRKKAASTVFDPKSGVRGWRLSIAGLQVSGDIASAGFKAVAGPMGVELYSVRLKKTNGAWTIIQWRLNGAA